MLHLKSYPNPQIQEIKKYIVLSSTNSTKTESKCHNTAWYKTIMCLARGTFISNLN